MSLRSEIKAWYELRYCDHRVYSQSIANFEFGWSVLEWDEKIGLIVAKSLWGK